MKSKSLCRITGVGMVCALAAFCTYLVLVGDPPNFLHSRLAHRAEQWLGISYNVAHPEPISDGSIVLIKKGNQVGAFVPTQQGDGTLTYTWYLRGDGKGSLDPLDDAVLTGTTNAAEKPEGKEIRFGEFSVAWSKRGSGTGWVYYSDTHCRSRTAPEWDSFMAVTDARDVRTIDALDAKWQFHNAPPKK